MAERWTGVRRAAVFAGLLVALAPAAVGVALAAGPATVPGRGAAAAVRPADLCPGGGADPARLVSCTVADLDRSWTARIGRPVRLRVTVDPAPGTVHRACRQFLAFGTAFYCPSDARVYVTATAVARDRREFGDRLPYALATIVAHEAGHRVQDAVDEPKLAAEGDAGSRLVEQQADCLAGVWAAGAARRGLLDLPAFRVVYAREMQIVSSLRPPRGSGLDGYSEVATHGTAAQRTAAFDRGAAAGDPVGGCQLPLRKR